ELLVGGHRSLMVYDLGKLTKRLRAGTPEYQTGGGDEARVGLPADAVRKASHRLQSFFSFHPRRDVLGHFLGGAVDHGGFDQALRHQASLTLVLAGSTQLLSDRPVHYCVVQPQLPGDALDLLCGEGIGRVALSLDLDGTLQHPFDISAAELVETVGQSLVTTVSGGAGRPTLLLVPHPNQYRGCRGLLVRCLRPTRRRRSASPNHPAAAMPPPRRWRHLARPRGATRPTATAELGSLRRR